MLLFIVTFYAAYRGIHWMVDWQQCKITASTLEWVCNCIMTCIATIMLCAIAFTMSIDVSIADGFSIDVNFAYELKPKE